MRHVATLIAFVIVLAACGATARERTLRTTLVAVNAARDGFVTYDATRQQSIVDGADTLEAGRAELVAYRKRREPIVEAFATSYRALAIAAVLHADPASLANVLDAARRLLELLEALGCDACVAVIP